MKNGAKISTVLLKLVRKFGHDSKLPAVKIFKFSAVGHVKYKPITCKFVSFTGFRAAVFAVTAQCMTER